VKVDFDLRNKRVNNNINVNFEGYKPVKDNKGVLVYEFNYPYDANMYDCYLEVCSVAQDDNKNYFINEGLKNLNSPDGYYKLHPERNLVDLGVNFNLRSDQDFAYHYVLVPKGADRNNPDTKPVYKIDAGDYIDSTRTNGGHEIYNIVTVNGAKTTNIGAMKLLMPDFYNPMWTYDKDGNIVKNPNIKNIRNINKTFANKIGGSLAGIEKDVRNGKFDGYDRIISTPIFTDDSLSSHGYWNKNCMQMIQSLGNINNYASLQREMFKKGINFVSDGAFVNEGLEGIHFKHLLKWGTKSPYFNWFKAHNLKDGPFTLGVFPKNNDFVTHKVVNAPFVCTQDAKTGKISTSANKSYDDKKPTYIQIFDKRIVSDELAKDKQKLIKAYDRNDNVNPLEIITHDDTLVPYSFEINPKTYLKNIQLLNEYNAKNKNDKILLNSYMGTRFVSKFENFELEEKIDSKVETWDANTDVIKLNFLYSNADNKQVLLNHENKVHSTKMKELGQKNYEVQDYAITAGKYWTGKTADILKLYVAQQLKATDYQNPQKEYQKILDKITAEQLPEKLRNEINVDIIKNVFNGSYKLTGGKTQMEFKDYLLASLMELPLDSIEFGDNLTAVLASPYITKRATDAESLGTSRYEMFIKNNPHLNDEYKNTYQQMDRIYTKELHDFATEIINNLNAKNQEGSKIYEGYNTTPFGKYVLPMVAEAITKFAIVKALAPKTDVAMNPANGDIVYDYDFLKETTIESLGIVASSPEDEAKQVLNKLKSGIKSISDADKRFLVDALYYTFKGTNVYSFQLAEMITDRLNAGLDWRIDATKDIANMDGLRDTNENLDLTWSKLTDFWKAFSQNVYEQNPNAYIVAEITDEDSLYQKTGATSSKYNSGGEMVKKFLRETGMTGTANYSYYFSSILNLFAKHFDNNDRYDTNGGFDEGASHRMNNKSASFFDLMPFKSIIGSYNFIGNHDKARTLHGLIINTDWYQQDLSNSKNHEYREKAYRILNGIFIGRTIPIRDGENENAYKERLEMFIESVDLSLANTKAIAMAESLQKGFEKAIASAYPYNEKAQINEKITDSVYKAIGELASGSYLGKDFSSEGLGVQPIETAVDLVINQAIKEHKLGFLAKNEIENLKNNTIRAILEPALTKLVAMTEVLSVMPGMPTLYAGDDLGATGYESATKNIYVKNRSYIRREWADPRNTAFNFMKDHYNKMNNILTSRARPELKAMNDGAPYLLPIQHGHTTSNNRPIDLSAILRQGTDGSIVVSLINTAGINYNFNEEYHPTQIKLDRIEVSDLNEYNPKRLTKGLTQGIILHNAKNPKETYIVKEYNGKNFIKRVNLDLNGNIKEELDTIINGTTLTLFSTPRKQVYDKKYYINPVYNKETENRIGEVLSYLAG